MSKYIIQSGGFRDKPENMQAYFRELLDIGKPEVNVLWCYFASEPDKFDEVHERYQRIFTGYLPTNISIRGEVARIDDFC